VKLKIFLSVFCSDLELIFHGILKTEFCFMRVILLSLSTVDTKKKSYFALYEFCLFLLNNNKYWILL
jgi:hypothetical protein